MGACNMLEKIVGIVTQDSVCVNPVEGMTLYGLVRKHRPAVVVETGTNIGCSTMYLAEAVKDNNEGHVYTADTSIKLLKDARTNIDRAGLIEYVTIRNSTGVAMIESLERVDFAFLDSGEHHEYEIVKPEYEALVPKMPSGSVLVMHDPNWFASVRRVYDEAEGWVKINYQYPTERGLGILIKQ